MFQDIKVSNDLNQGFKKEYQDKGDIAGKLLFVIKCFLPLSQAYKLWAHHVVYTRVFYKIIQLVRALWLAIKPFYISSIINSEGIEKTHPNPFSYLVFEHNFLLRADVDWLLIGVFVTLQHIARFETCRMPKNTFPALRDNPAWRQLQQSNPVFPKLRE